MKKSVMLSVLLSVLSLGAQQPTLQIFDPAPNSSQPPATKEAVMGSTGVLVGQYMLAVSGTNNIQLKALAVFDNTTSTVPCLTNVQVWSGSTAVGTASMPTPGTNGGFVYQIYFPAVAIPRGQAAVGLRADITPFLAIGGECDNSLHQLEIIDPSTIQAFAGNSGSPALVEAIAFGSEVRIRRSTLTVTAARETVPIAAAPFFITTNSAGTIVLNKISIDFGTAAGTNGMILVDQNGNDVTTTGEAFTKTSGEIMTWLFPSGYVVSAGSSVMFAIRGTGQLISAARIEAPTDIVFTDALGGKTANPLQQQFPILIVGQ